MGIGTTKILKSIPPFSRALLRYHYTPTRQASPSPVIAETVEEAVRAKAYQQIPNLLTSHEQACRNPNPFSFLSNAPQRLRTQVIDEILQSFVTIRPRYRPRIAYSSLLFYTLQSPDPFPLSLAIIQQTLRCGCVPVPQTRLLLSSKWMEHRHGRSQSVRKILSDMKLIEYNPDANTCNYLLSCLCSVDQLKEAVLVLKGMAGAGCVPDLDCYDTVIRGFCKSKRTTEAVGLVKEMVEKLRLTPRQGTLVEVAWTLRAKREMWRAVETVEFLERQGEMVGFECHEVVVNGCLECGEYLLAGKAVMLMTKKGFLPRIEVRREIVQRLADIGEWKVACSVRERFAELRS